MYLDSNEIDNQASLELEDQGFIHPSLSPASQPASHDSSSNSALNEPAELALWFFVSAFGICTLYFIFKYCYKTIKLCDRMNQVACEAPLLDNNNKA